MLSGEYRTELLKEVKVNEELKRIARDIKKKKTHVECMETLQKELINLKKGSKTKFLFEDFTLAIDNRL